MVVENQQRVELGQIGPDFIVSLDDTVLPRGVRCELHATAGPEESMWPVLLPDGLGPDHREARIVASPPDVHDDIPF